MIRSLHHLPGSSLLERERYSAVLQRLFSLRMLLPIAEVIGMVPGDSSGTDGFMQDKH